AELQQRLLLVGRQLAGRRTKSGKTQGRTSTRLLAPRLSVERFGTAVVFGAELSCELSKRVERALGISRKERHRTCVARRVRIAPRNDVGSAMVQFHDRVSQEQRHQLDVLVVESELR